jgi:hypothetical protein
VSTTIVDPYEFIRVTYGLLHDVAPGCGFNVWLQELELPRLVNGLGACSLCFMTNCPCGDVVAGIRLYEAECDEEKKYWRDLLNESPYGDGECQNKPVVRERLQHFVPTMIRSSENICRNDCAMRMV